MPGQVSTTAPGPSEHFSRPVTLEQLQTYARKECPGQFDSLPPLHHYTFATHFVPIPSSGYHGAPSHGAAKEVLLLFIGNYHRSKLQSLKVWARPTGTTVNLYVNPSEPPPGTRSRTPLSPLDESVEYQVVWDHPFNKIGASQTGGEGGAKKRARRQMMINYVFMLKGELEFVESITVRNHVTGGPKFGKPVNVDPLAVFSAACIDYYKNSRRADERARSFQSALGISGSDDAESEESLSPEETLTTFRLAPAAEQQTRSNSVPLQGQRRSVNFPNMARDSNPTVRDTATPQAAGATGEVASAPAQPTARTPSVPDQPSPSPATAMAPNNATVPPPSSAVASTVSDNQSVIDPSLPGITSQAPNPASTQARPPTMQVAGYDIDHIVEKRVYQRNYKAITQYKVNLQGRPDRYNTWVDGAQVDADLIREFDELERRKKEEAEKAAMGASASNPKSSSTASPAATNGMRPPAKRKDRARETSREHRPGSTSASPALTNGVRPTNKRKNRTGEESREGSQTRRGSSPKRRRMESDAPQEQSPASNPNQGQLILHQALQLEGPDNDISDLHGPGATRAMELLGQMNHAVIQHVISMEKQLAEEKRLRTEAEAELPLLQAKEKALNEQLAEQKAQFEDLKVQHSSLQDLTFNANNNSQQEIDELKLEVADLQLEIITSDNIAKEAEANAQMAKEECEKVTLDKQEAEKKAKKEEQEKQEWKKKFEEEAAKAKEREEKAKKEYAELEKRHKKLKQDYMASIETNY